MLLSAFLNCSALHQHQTACHATQRNATKHNATPRHATTRSDYSKKRLQRSDITRTRGHMCVPRRFNTYIDCGQRDSPRAIAPAVTGRCALLSSPIRSSPINALAFREIVSAPHSILFYTAVYIYSLHYCTKPNQTKSNRTEPN